MKTSTIIILAIYLGFALIELWRSGLFSKPEQTRGDGIVEAVSTVVLLFVTQPFVLFASAGLAGVVVPQYEGALTGIPIIAAVALFLVFDDMTQYWWHRAAHSFPLLYKLHRPHHDGRYMSIRLVYRNNLFYYLTMPGIWCSGVLIYLGLGYVYAGYIVVKLAVIIGAHSDVAWDRPLYKIAWLSPVMWVVERTISTPSTHHAHHGRHKSDGVTHYKGNFGNLLFFWDILFGTAKITRRYPESYGVENLPETSTGEMLVWPLISTGHSAEATDPTAAPSAA
ncbi:MAG: sterol desaturase family protein [Pseudomonadota bacterium]